jgi:hypothetical protein
MSQQAVAGCRGGRSGRGKPRYHLQSGELKGFKSLISKIAHDTFNTGQNKFAVQFTQSRNNVANYFQCTATLKGYLVAETVCTGRKQIIDLPSAIDPNNPELEDKKIIWAEEIKTITKRHLKLEDSLKKGYATVYDQCLQEVQDKLESTDNWERTQKEQSLHELIQKIECISMGFDNHKQEVFNLVQVLKTLFLYTQGEKDTVEKFGCNFRSLWETVEAFGGSPGVHKGLVDGLLSDMTQVNNVRNPTNQEIAKAENDSCKAVKATLLISGADKRRYGKLKDKLANNYLLGSDQYPDTFKKAMHILDICQVGKTSVPFRASPNNTGVAFIQQGGRGSSDVSTITGGPGGDTPKMNSRGELHCYNCGAADHWAYECPHLSNEQQQQLHMNSDAQDDVEEVQEEGHQLLNVTFAQGAALPENRAYINECLVVTAFRTDKYLKGIKTLNNGIKINCNARVVTTNRMGSYGNLKVWYLPKGIANIFLMYELEKLSRITYNSWMGHYVVHTPKGAVNFYKDKQGLPYIDLDGTEEEAAIMLLQHVQGKWSKAGGESMEAIETALVQTVQGNYEGYTKKNILKAKEARRAQGMIGNPSKKDYKGMVSGNLITNCPITTSYISNAHAIFGPDLTSIRGKTVQRTWRPWWQTMWQCLILW